MAKHNLSNTHPSLVEQFRAALAGQRRKPAEPAKKAKHRIDDEQYVEMMWRMVRGLEDRACSNPAILPQVVELQNRFLEVANVAVAYNALNYRIDPRAGASMAECAAALDISKASAGERASVGIRMMIERVEAAGIVRFAERAREREIIETARDKTVVSLADWFQRRAA